ncbi:MULTISPECIES: class I SAM-dependent methyltransferase [unclassified Devosia]|uniref:class I SAM-dependent methyltransferase n=1 Tax=unclassified Devosia TaxID=196773 RepID=UPI00086923A9|nr:MULTISPECIES: class I SAM-dependent methyltransferase [unclassified Devosia]MBN9363221.1 class I SAM-dependent methyltransferase [Devosia sp.]ODS82952.1 MAG: hypothetical protein ABS47_21600 [Devosia sp. SCN 66-27]OJX25068.1 MAG: hypothetical protein BGO83_09250 [Devosia sp. 66-14]
MPQTVYDVIALPFEEGLLEARNAFLLRGDFSPALRDSFGGHLVAEQTYRPAYERLAAGGVQVTTQLEGSYDVGLCVLTPHRQENYANLARAYRLLAPGGTLVCAGQNAVGAATYEKAVGAIAPLEGRISKAKCRVFWLRRGSAEADSARWREWLSLGDPQPIAGTPFSTRPGIFSWNRIDPGSQFLVDSLPPGIDGAVADLGAGWGFLAASLLQRYDRIRQLDLFEAEKLALDLAQANLAPSGRSVGYHWSDVRAGIGRSKYDWVITNPPFHKEGEQDIDLGVTFLTVAAEALRGGGRLVCVANRHLPYERTLRTAFSDVSVLAENRGFKVLLARK